MNEKINVEFCNLKDVPQEGFIALTTFEQADGAIANGTLVRKINSAPNDSHRDGAVARVIGSLSADQPRHMVHPNVRLYGYFVLWEDNPKIPCFIADTRIEKVEVK